MPTFGPVPSRRLGRSLGINTIPPRTCSYSCVYYQLGRTTRMLAEPRELSDPAAILREVEEKLASARGRGERVDILTFVPDGEPTLDTGLGREIESLRPLGVRIGVITNASLLWRREAREALGKADWSAVRTLLDQQALVEVPYRGDTFYVRRFTAGKQHDAIRPSSGPVPGQAGNTRALDAF